MSRRPPLRDRTAAQFRQQAEEFRDAAARAPSPDMAARLRRLAESYEDLAVAEEALSKPDPSAPASS